MSVRKIVNREIWSDLEDLLRIDSSGNLKKVINEDSVRNSIRNILGTWKGERVFLCRFGSGLNDLVFENINESLLSRLSDSIKDSIESWDNRVIVSGVDFNATDDRNEVVVTVKFQIRSYTEVFSTTIRLNQ